MELTDERLLAALRDGARVANLSDRLGVGWESRRQEITRRLKKLEAAGLVRKHERYSSDNSYYWVHA